LDFDFFFAKKNQNPIKISQKSYPKSLLEKNSTTLQEVEILGGFLVLFHPPQYFEVQNLSKSFKIFGKV
jgi:uncharacterized membrane protein